MLDDSAWMLLRCSRSTVRRVRVEVGSSGLPWLTPFSPAPGPDREDPGGTSETEGAIPGAETLTFVPDVCAGEFEGGWDRRGDDMAFDVTLSTSREPSASDTRQTGRTPQTWRLRVVTNGPSSRGHSIDTVERL
jgi:hypothetical protein